MSAGTFYGIGIGPGDPELLTVKAVRTLEACRHVFVPKARQAAESVASAIAGRYIRPDAAVREIVFPMTRDADELAARWREAAEAVRQPLAQGQDACFLTLEDPMLYSTFIYLVRALRDGMPGLRVITVPGITSMCAAAAAGGFALGEGDEPVTIVPAAGDVELIRRAAALGGTLVLMKIGRHLSAVLDVLEELKMTDHALFAARVGQNGERVVTDLRALRREGPEAGYLFIILAKAGKEAV